MTDIANFPLFPLKVVLVPGELLPLHIFEERYQTMINECLEQKSQFGIVWWDETRMSTLGCSAQVVDVVHRYPDGRMDIVAIGRSRFKINTTVDLRSYLLGEISFFYDQTEIPDPGLSERAIKAHFDYLRFMNAEIPPDKYRQNAKKNTSFFISVTAGLSLAEKQQLLEITSENERLMKLIFHLEENKKIIYQAHNIWPQRGEA